MTVLSSDGFKTGGFLHVFCKARKLMSDVRTQAELSIRFKAKRPVAAKCPYKRWQLASIN